MSAACDFDAIPRSITSAGSVRFFPRVSGFTRPIVTYAWTFGDTGTSALATPIHVYPATSTPATYNVSLTVTDSDGHPETVTHNNFISQDAAGNVPAYPTDGTYHQVSVLIYNDTDSMVVNRNPWAGCHFYLMTPKTLNPIDKIGTATFSLLDVGDSDATEKSLRVEGSNVVMVMGKTVTFSGKIRRVTQNTQNGFTTSTRVKLWDVECDSDLAKLQKIDVSSAVLSSTGAALYDTPGNLVRLVLTPASGVRDTRGVINCVDTKISYQLNSLTTAESAGNQYDHLMALQALTNYDVRARPDFLLYLYTAFDGSTVITNSSAGWTVNEFVGMYAVFVGRGLPASKAFTTNYAVNNDRLLITDANLYFAVNDRVTLSNTGGALPTGLSATTYYVKSVTATYITISTAIGGAAVTVSTNGTGTHAIILKAETSGVMTFGKITANDGTTITCAAMVNAAVAPQSLGYFLIYRGYLIDFAQDLSQPYAITNMDVNQKVFDYSDNDDKRKLSTKIVASGKDLQGITISVALTAVHAYDLDRQFFKDATAVTYPSEGYIYKNTCAATATPVTVFPKLADSTYSWTIDATPSILVFSGTPAVLTVGAEVKFSTAGTLPSPLVAGTTYYVVAYMANVYFSVSATPGSAAISVSGGSGTWYVYMPHTWWFAANMTIPSQGMISISGTTVPTGNTFGAIYWAWNMHLNNSGGGVFNLAATSNGSTIQDATGAGSAVYAYPISGMVNTGYSSGVPSTSCYIWVYGWGYAIPASTAMAIVWGSSARAFTTSGSTIEQTMEDGTKVTRITITPGDMLVQDQEFSGRGFVMSPRLYVIDASQVGTNEVLIGEEKITVTATGTSATYGPYIDVGAATARVTSATLKCYPHGVGALVARTNYTEASPETGSGLDLYGLYIDPRTVDNNTTYGALDAYVTNLLLGLGNFYKKGTTWGPMALCYVPHVGEYYGGLVQTSLQVPPRPTDRLSFTEYTGATPEEFQIVSVTIDHDQMTVTLELGDFEKNVYTSLQQSTNAINRTLS
jgi:hypothetical protein